MVYFRFCRQQKVLCSIQTWINEVEDEHNDPLTTSSIPTSLYLHQHHFTFTNITLPISTPLYLYQHHFTYINIPLPISTSLYLYQHQITFININSPIPQNTLRIPTSLYLYHHLTYINIPLPISTSDHIYQYQFTYTTKHFTYTNIPFLIPTSLNLYQRHFTYTNPTANDNIFTLCHFPCTFEILIFNCNNGFWRKLQICEMRSSLCHCDQTVRFFFNIWPLETMKISPIMSQICQRRLSIWANKKYTVENLPKTCKLLPKWQNFAKSGHTEFAISREWAFLNRVFLI